MNKYIKDFITNKYINVAKKYYYSLNESEKQVFQIVFARQKKVSEYPLANAFKVASRISITKKFICLNDEDKVLDVGGVGFIKMADTANFNGDIKIKDEYLPLPDNSYDYCLSMQTLEHTYNPVLHLKEMVRIAEKGIFVSIPYRKSTHVIKKTKNKKEQHIIEFSVDDFKRLVKHCRLKIVQDISFPLCSWSLIGCYYKWHKIAIYLCYIQKEVNNE